MCDTLGSDSERLLHHTFFMSHHTWRGGLGSPNLQNVQRANNNIPNSLSSWAKVNPARESISFLKKLSEPPQIQACRTRIIITEGYDFE